MINFTGSFTLSFKNTKTVYRKKYSCTVLPNEFNFSYNHSMTSDGISFSPFVYQDGFHTYVTSIGLYNEEKELLAVAKLAVPVMVSNKIETTFDVLIDL